MATATVAPVDDSVFVPDQTQESDAPESNEVQENNIRLFMSESGFSGPETIMKHLTPDERTQVFDLVEQDISTEFKKREEDLRQKYSDDLTKAENNFKASLDSIGENLLQAMSSHMKETADASARMTILLAEKIVRSKIDTDPEILVRALETTLFKVDSSKTVIINVNPEQVEFLNDNPEMLARLGIDQVVADRRVDVGGCLIKTEKMEWDGTIKGQLEYLSELIEEMIVTGDAPDLSGKGQSSDEPSLD